METIKNVSISELHSFRNHPFKVETNTELCELMRSIEKEVIIKCGDNVIYDSLMKLKRRMLVFAGEREKELSSVEVGGYVVLAPSEVDISGVEVETSIIKTVEDYK